MQAVVLVSVHHYIPYFGLAWGTPPQLCVASLIDSRTFRHFEKWLNLVVLDKAKLCVICSSGAVKRRLVDTIHSSPHNIEIDIKAVKDIVQFEEDAPPQSKLLDQLANQARSYYNTIYSFSDKSFTLVCCINEEITTVTDQVLRDLNIISNSNSKSFVDNPTIQTFIQSKIKTAMGKSRLEAFLKHPLINVEAIKARQALFQKLFDDRQFRLQCHGCCLSQIANLDQMCDQFVVANKLSIKARKHLVSSFPSLLDSIAALSTLTFSILKKEDDDTILNTQYIGPLESNVTRLLRLRDLILKVFDLDSLIASRYEPDVLLLNSDLVPEIKEAREGVESCMDEIEKHRLSVERKLDCPKKVKVVPDSKEGRIFRVPRSVDIAPDYTLIRINKAETLFTTSKLQRLNVELTEYKDKVDSTESMFIDKVLTIAATYEDPFRQVADIIGYLDIMCACASALNSTIGDRKWKMPTYIQAEKPSVSLTHLKHPLLELRNQLRGGDQTITPNTIELNGESRRLILVTGPNMGGKSTYARQCALACYLGQLGLPVPAAEATMTPFTVMWTRIGADDRPAQGMSTFFTEALETALMLSTISAHPEFMQRGSIRSAGLLLIDELGRGTSALDGFAFAKAVMQDLTETNPHCLSIFATHFHELGFVENVHPIKMVPISEGGTRVLYNAEEGVEKDSDGIKLAAKFNFPNDIIQEALQCIKH